MRQRLRGFAQPHIVGQDAGQALFAQILQPGQTFALVGPQFQPQPLGRLDGFDAALMLQLTGELDHCFAACALPLRVGRDVGQTRCVQPRHFEHAWRTRIEQVDEGARQRFETARRGGEAHAFRRVQGNGFGIADFLQLVRVQPACVALKQVVEQRRQRQALAFQYHAQIER